MNNIKKEAIEKSANWWYCDNIINHPKQVGLLYMGFPRVFILIRDYDIAYWAGYEEWKNDIIEINFFDPKDRECTDLEPLLIDAWNFLALNEEEEERLAIEREKLRSIGQE